MKLNKYLLALAMSLAISGKQENLSEPREVENKRLKGTPPNPNRKSKKQRKTDKRARQASRKLTP